MKDERLKVKRILFFLSIFIFQFSICFAADSVKDLQKKQKKLQEEIEQTNKMLKQTKKDEKATMNKLQLIGQNIKNQKKLITTLDSEITALNREMRQLNTTRDSLQRVLERYKNEYAEMVRQSYRPETRKHDCSTCLARRPSNWSLTTSHGRSMYPYASTISP